MSPFSWLRDSTCGNHMTPHLSLFSQLELAPHLLNIYTTNGFSIFRHNICSISTSNLSALGIFNVHNLSYNLFYVGQLAKLDYLITFDYSRCIVQDSRTRQELGLALDLGICFPWTIFVFHILLLFLLLLQLLQFLLFLPLQFACLTWSHIFLSGTKLGF